MPPLNQLKIKNGLPAGKHADGKGLYLEVMKSGGAKWRMKYRISGVERRISLGSYPEVGLAQARELALEARATLRQGKDPVAVRREREAALVAQARTFGDEAAAWMASKSPRWADETRRKMKLAVDGLLSSLSGIPIATLASKDVVKVLLKLEERAPEIARKARQAANRIVRFAIAAGNREEDKLLVLDEVLSAVERGHIPAVTYPEEIGALLRDVCSYESPVVRSALLMAAYTAQRPHLIAEMRWKEVVDAEWRIDWKKMKRRHDHIVPLQKQALAILEEMRAYTGGREYVFPPLARQKSKHLSRDTLSKTLRELGWQGRHSTHGFRAALRTAGRERLGIEKDVLDAQLAHPKKGQVEKAYDRTTFGEQRRVEMQRWADWIDGLASKVTPLQARG